MEKFREDPSALSNLDSAELAPLREIIDKNRAGLEALQDNFARRKLIYNFILTIINEDLRQFFPKLQFAKNIADKYPYALRNCKVIEDKIFAPTIPLEKFLSIMKKYFRLKRERNTGNHAGSVSG